MSKILADELGLSKEFLDEKLLANNFIIIPKDEYKQLQHDQAFLECLCANGVDNWDWYDEACEQFNRENGEDE